MSVGQILITLLPLLDRGNRRQLIKTLLLVLYAKRNNIVVETLYFISCLMFDLLAVIYKCFAFRVLLVFVWASVRSDPLLLHSVMLVFLSLPVKLQ